MRNVYKPLLITSLPYVLYLQIIPGNSHHIPLIVGFVVLTAATIKRSIFLDITPCSPLEFNLRFEGICRLHLLGRRISQARNQLEAGSKQSNPLAESGVCCLLYTGFLHGLLLDPEDEEDVFLRDVG
jgi:hypothetical protein